MATTYYTATVPFEDSKGNTRYRRVGALFENTRKETGEGFFSLTLDFPVAVKEIVCFAPSAKEGQDDT